MEPIGTYRTARGRLALVTDAWELSAHGMGKIDPAAYIRAGGLGTQAARTFRAFYWDETPQLQSKARGWPFYAFGWRRRPAGA